MLLRDAITIPTEVRQGDLVFKLTDATEHSSETVARYVVTDQLLSAFSEAAALVGAAVREHSSKAAFLSGSFGAGKSNFMGMLQLLLDAHPAALARPELAPVVASMSQWRTGQKFLTVPFHLIGAASLESALFGTYVAHMQALHPDAPLPDLFADEPILDNADVLRQRLGDDAFFAALNETDNIGETGGTAGGTAGAGSAGDGWGDLGGWDAARYEAARLQPVGGDDRRLLVQALLSSLLTSFAEGAAANREGYVDIDTGLAAISRHAHSLGYSGVILFLDELILWLMSRMADASFVAAEASKISKLVEASDAKRPAPLISIIARQRDLRDLIGSDVPGAERLGFIDQLNFQAGRFSDIALNDSNLPVVAHHRLLQPVDDAGAAALRAAFDSLALTDDQRDAMRGESGTDADFALTYPFSPAFLNVVVDVAGALQRTRTGLRVLLDLLVRHRDTLEVGHLVPVGDLFDVLADSDEPLSDAMKPQFESARRIYKTTLRPMLVGDHGLTEEAIATDGATAAFVTDDRLVKTLLLAALVPHSAPFQNLTARKLVALNHGLISSPVPGMEVGVVVTKLNNWAARAGELQVGGDPHNPTVNLVLSEVDTRAILNSVSSVDNLGSRRKLVRDLLAEELGVSTDQLLQSTTHLWRGIKRSADLVFGNVRDTSELNDASFASSGNAWKIVIDFPFDDEGHSPHEDLARVAQLRALGHEWRTLCWIPSFFTAEMRSQLGALVRLNHLLPVPGQSSDRFTQATRHLSPEARESARPQLEAQQNAARSRLLAALKQAYGLGSPDAAVVDSSHALADHFSSLLSGFTVRPPVATSLREALEKVFEQALEHSYPAAPQIDAEVRPADLRTVRDLCDQALEAPDRRIAQVPTAERRVMSRIANPLRLGVQSEQAFLLDVSQRWEPHFTRKIAERAQSGAEGHVTVAELRAWIDDPSPMGLSKELANLVLIVWAAATDRIFTDHGGPARVAIDSLSDHYEVVSQELPSPADWATAVDRAARVLGVAGLADEPSAVALARLSGRLANAANEHLAAVESLGGELETLAALVGAGGAAGGTGAGAGGAGAGAGGGAAGGVARITTATNAARLLGAIASAGSDLAKVDAFVAADLSPSPEAIGASIKSATAVSSTIAGIDVKLLATAMTRSEGAHLGERLGALLNTEEYVTQLAPALSELVKAAREIVFAEAAPTPPAVPAAPAVSVAEVAEMAAVVDAPAVGLRGGGEGGGEVTSEAGLSATAAAKRLSELRDEIDAGTHGEGPFEIVIRSLGDAPS